MDVSTILMIAICVLVPWFGWTMGGWWLARRNRQIGITIGAATIDITLRGGKGNG